MILVNKKALSRKKNTYKPVLGILQNLLGGSFKIVDNQVFYLPRKERNRSQIPVPFYLASSAVKSIFLIDLYVNCLAEKNGLLIIDEPELNLHPENQRKMASLLARLVTALCVFKTYNNSSGQNNCGDEQTRSDI